MSVAEYSYYQRQGPHLLSYHKVVEYEKRSDESCCDKLCSCVCNLICLFLAIVGGLAILGLIMGPPKQKSWYEDLL